jgi:hypothetical protein
VTKSANRPESWNAKMALSGEPLITDEQFEKLLANAPASLDEMETHDPVPVVKIFLPHIRWILAWIYPHDRDRAFAVVQLGRERPRSRRRSVIRDCAVSPRQWERRPEARARQVHHTRPADKSLLEICQPVVRP